MKNFWITFVITVIGLASFSCSSDQDSTNSIETNVTASEALNTEITSTSRPVQTTETPQAAATPTSTIHPTVTATFLRYWGNPVSADFAGEWVEYENRDYGFSFKYPQPNGSSPCGKLLYNVHSHISQLNFQKGGILIMFSYVGNPDLVAHARNYPNQFNSELITDVEQFFIGGKSAVRFIYDGVSSYTKKAYVIKNGILFDFGFREGNFSECDTPELPEEQMYETIISTWQFLE